MGMVDYAVKKCCGNLAVDENVVPAGKFKVCCND
jgi:hypothetical protein